MKKQMTFLVVALLMLGSQIMAVKQPILPRLSGDQYYQISQIQELLKGSSKKSIEFRKAFFSKIKNEYEKRGLKIQIGFDDIDVLCSRLEAEEIHLQPKVDANSLWNTETNSIESFTETSNWDGLGWVYHDNPNDIHFAFLKGNCLNIVWIADKGKKFNVPEVTEMEVVEEERVTKKSTDNVDHYDTTYYHTVIYRTSEEIYDPCPVRRTYYDYCDQYYDPIIRVNFSWWWPIYPSQSSGYGGMQVNNYYNEENNFITTNNITNNTTTINHRETPRPRPNPQPEPGGPGGAPLIDGGGPGGAGLIGDNGGPGGTGLINDGGGQPGSSNTTGTTLTSRRVNPSGNITQTQRTNSAEVKQMKSLGTSGVRRTSTTNNSSSSRANSSSRSGSNYNQPSRSSSYGSSTRSSYGQRSSYSSQGYTNPSSRSSYGGRPVRSNNYGSSTRSSYGQSPSYSSQGYTNPSSRSSYGSHNTSRNSYGGSRSSHLTSRHR